MLVQPLAPSIVWSRRKRNPLHISNALKPFPLLSTSQATRIKAIHHELRFLDGRGSSSFSTSPSAPKISSRRSISQGCTADTQSCIVTKFLPDDASGLTTSLAAFPRGRSIPQHFNRCTVLSSSSSGLKSGRAPQAAVISPFSSVNSLAVPGSISSQCSRCSSYQSSSHFSSSSTLTVTEETLGSVSGD